MKRGEKLCTLLTEGLNPQSSTILPPARTVTSELLWSHSWSHDRLETPSRMGGGEIVSSNFLEKVWVAERGLEEALPTSAKASRKIVVRAGVPWQLGIYVPHKFMRLRGPFFRSRIPFANPSLPLSPSLSVLSCPPSALFLSLHSLSSPTAFRHSAGSFPSYSLPPIHESLLACGQFATYYQVKYRGRFVITGSSTLPKRSYNSCPCCGDKNRRRDVLCPRKYETN